MKMKHKYIILLILLFFVLPANLGAQEKAIPKMEKESNYF